MKNETLKMISGEDHRQLESDSDSDSDVEYDIPPVFSDDISEFEISDETCLIHFDVDKCKQDYGVRERDAILEYYKIIKFKDFLPAFTHPGNPTDCYQLTRINAETLEGTYDAARQAITIYNNLTKKGKLELEKIVESTVGFWTGADFFMTFSAKNTDTGETGMYRAAIHESARLGCLLGLLLPSSSDIPLAILALTGKGVEKALASKRRLLRLRLGGENAMNETDEVSEDLEDEDGEAEDSRNEEQIEAEIEEERKEMRKAIGILEEERRRKSLEASKLVEEERRKSREASKLVEEDHNEPCKTPAKRPRGG